MIPCPFCDRPLFLCLGCHKPVCLHCSLNPKTHTSDGVWCANCALEAQRCSPR